jgi:ADP-ribose pyrophosphatase YjhB (NUDIX family)
MPPGPVTLTAHKAVPLALTKRVVQEHLARRMLAQPADLASTATRGKRPALHRSEHRELDLSERIADSHPPSLRPLPPGLNPRARRSETRPGASQAGCEPTSVRSMEAVIDETMVLDGRRYHISWFDPPFRPPLERTTQALGVCFTADRQIVLVTLNDKDWTLPGGTVEQGETLEQTLAREVQEEACARVVDCAYLGCQLVDELDIELPAYYQTRFWARVELDPFQQTHEMTARQLVTPAEFRTALFWGTAPTAELILAHALALEATAPAMPPDYA